MIRFRDVLNTYPKEELNETARELQSMFLQTPKNVTRVSKLRKTMNEINEEIPLPHDANEVLINLFNRMPLNVQKLFAFERTTTIKCNCNNDIRIRNNKVFDLVLTSSNVLLNQKTIDFNQFVDSNFTDVSGKCSTCDMPKLTTTSLKWDIQNQQYLIVSLKRLVNNLAIIGHEANRQQINGNFLNLLTLFLGVYWKLIAIIEHLPGHYVAWRRDELNKSLWIKLDDNYLTIKTRLNKGLLNYNVLVYEKE